MIAFPQSIYNDTLLLLESAVLSMVANNTSYMYFKTFQYTIFFGSVEDLTLLDKPVDKTEYVCTC